MIHAHIQLLDLTSYDASVSITFSTGPSPDSVRDNPHDRCQNQQAQCQNDKEQELIVYRYR